MRVVILYRPNSEQERPVLDFQGEFKRRTNLDLELLSLDTVEGSSLAELYAIDTYPAVLAIDPNGGLHSSWQGMMMPMINEVAYYKIQ